MRRASLPNRPVQCVIFAVGETHHAIDIDHVREILVPPPLTPMPGAPPHVLGLAQVRGHAIPVIDLAAALGLPAGEDSDRKRLVVVAAGEGATALLVDAVEEVATCAPAEFEAVLVPGMAGERVVIKRNDLLVGWLEPDDVPGMAQERVLRAA
ncbi:chemotaxis protein CheW [Tepidiforma sp.]|uniref:chemotaxis protein CheW n=1 Tax=Tepidiforma sp. TaxID=2682230 RepID=UPI002ADDA834|nr:chemotaxis protein CheW [Tepidiforma sp.]